MFDISFKVMIYDFRVTFKFFEKSFNGSIGGQYFGTSIKIKYPHRTKPGCKNYWGLVNRNGNAAEKEP